MPISKEQQKFLKGRLESIHSEKPGRWEEVQLEDTPAVKKARRDLASAQAIIDAHKKKKETMSKDRRAAILKAYNRCGQIIQFGNPDAAIKAIDEYEATKF
jgi:hypothetical protein